MHLSDQRLADIVTAGPLTEADMAAAIRDLERIRELPENPADAHRDEIRRDARRRLLERSRMFGSRRRP